MSKEHPLTVNKSKNISPEGIIDIIRPERRWIYNKHVDLDDITIDTKIRRQLDSCDVFGK